MISQEVVVDTEFLDSVVEVSDAHQVIVQIPLKRVRAISALTVLKEQLDLIGIFSDQFFVGKALQKEEVPLSLIIFQI